jgi:ubiquinone/menaquinone biosynthesis C-methylase UbiE
VSHWRETALWRYNEGIIRNHHKRGIMSEQLPYEVPAYSILAEVYNQAGLADYAGQSVSRYINYALSINWAGRRVLDVGCGTGVSTWILAEQGFRVAGVDSSVAMLAQAQQQPDDLPVDNNIVELPTFVQGDMRQLESPIGRVDLILAIGGVMNEIQNLRELEITFRQISRTLEPGKLFIFDMRTIRGLAHDLGENDTVAYDNTHNLMLVIRNSFSYETLSSMRHYIIYQQQGLRWSRTDEIHVERGYPTQAVVAMLQRTGFEVLATLSPDMGLFDIRQDLFGRAVFVAQKQPA